MILQHAAGKSERVFSPAEESLLGGNRHHPRGRHRLLRAEIDLAGHQPDPVEQHLLAQGECHLFHPRVVEPEHGGEDQDRRHDAEQEHAEADADRGKLHGG